MDELSLDERCNRFWEECDGWVSARLTRIKRDGADPGEDIAAQIEGGVEAAVTALLEQCVERYGESFDPRVLTDLHRLYFELALQEHGIGSAEDLHRYKDNGMIGLSVARGAMLPDNALLLMEINRAHAEKKGGNEDAVCEDCICGKNQGG